MWKGALEIDAGNIVANTTWRQTLIENWGAEAIVQGAGTFYQNLFESLVTDDFDADDKNAVFNFNGGTMNTASILGANPDPARTGTDSRIIQLNGSNTDLSIRHAFCGGAAGQFAFIANANFSLIVDSLQYEPTNQQANTFALVSGSGKVFTREIMMASGSVSDVYVFAGGGIRKSPPPKLREGASQATNSGFRRHINVHGDTDNLPRKSGDVLNDSGAALSQPVACLGDLTTVG